MLKTINLNEHLGLCESSIPKGLVKVNTQEDLYENQVVGDAKNGVFLIVSYDNNYKLLGGIDKYLEKEYLKNTMMEVLSGKPITKFKKSPIFNGEQYLNISKDTY